MTRNVDDGSLPYLLSEWHLLLQAWSADVRLSAAAQEVLLLQAESPAQAELIARLSMGDSAGLLPIILLSSTDIHGALGVDTLATGTIYINADWLVPASKDEAFAVLTQELGHDLVGLANAADTYSDEGEHFPVLLSGQALSDARKKAPKLTTVDRLIASLLPAWHLLLKGWSADGRLSAASQEALLLPSDAPPLADLVKQWSAGEFGGLPPVLLLSSTDINGAQGSYVISNGTIYLNSDWLAEATKDQVFAVLTEELGHHLDGVLNAVDTVGDEGEYFAALLGGQVLSDAKKKALRGSNDFIMINSSGADLQAEAALSTFTYQELNSATNGDVYSADGTQRAELFLGAGPFDLTGINSASPSSFVIQIQGTRSDGSDNDFFVIRPETDLILPPGTVLDDYAIDIIEYGSSINQIPRVYSGSVAFEDRANPFWNFTSVAGQPSAGTSSLRYNLSSGDRFLAIQAYRDNVTGINRPDPYIIELSFVYKPAASVAPRLSIVTLVASQAEGNSGSTPYTFTIER
jgi:hypothetical protein